MNDPNYTPSWEWDGMKVSESTFNNKVKTLYRNKGVSVKMQEYSYNEILELLYSYLD